MKTATLTTETGCTWTTSINGTDEEIREYFLGRQFDCGSYPTEDFQTVVKCEIHNPDDIRKGFNQAISKTSDPDTVAELEVCREYFTNPDFRAKLENFVWEVNQ